MAFGSRAWGQAAERQCDVQQMATIYVTLLDLIFKIEPLISLAMTTPVGAMTVMALNEVARGAPRLWRDWGQGG